MPRRHAVLDASLSRRVALGALGASVIALGLGDRLGHAAGQTPAPDCSPAKECLMYTVVERRTVNPATIEETIRRGAGVE